MVAQGVSCAGASPWFIRRSLDAFCSILIHMEPVTLSIKLDRKDRIFIVEDEKIVAEDLRTILENHDYAVVGMATSGQEAVNEIKRLQPDLVLMDVRIQGELNGIEVAIVIQSYFDDPIPVVFLTGFAEKSFSYLKVLTDYIYINKPFSEQVLLSAVERALKKNKPDRDR
jgi:CheY-like chemotaxis protein